MAYGTIKVDTVTFTDGGIDKSVSISGLVQNPTFSGNITVTGTISGNTVQGQTVSGATVTGNAAAFTTVTGGTATITSGVFASGTAGAPSVSVGTTDNGIYSPGTDQVAVATNGTGRLFVDAGGNVGVGLSPSYRLDVAGPFRFRAQGYLYDTAGTSQLMRFTEIGTRDARMDAFNGADFNGTLRYAAANLLFETGAGAGVTERLRITSAGLVGIGTASVNALLEVNNPTAGGEVQRIEGNYSGSGSVILTNWRRAGGSVAAALKYNDDSSPLCMSIGTTTSHEFRIRTADTDAITIDTSQRVGIGTSSPGQKLDVNGEIVCSPNTAGKNTFQFTTQAADDASLLMRSNTTVKVNIQANGTSYFNGGNVGIGTTSPEEALVVANGALQVTGTLSSINRPSSSVMDFFGGATRLFSIGADASTYGQFIFQTSTTTSNLERARIDSSGRLLVGTSDGSGGVSKLIVQGASNGSAVGVAQISYDGLASAGLGAGTDIGYLRFTDQGSNSGVFAQITATADATTGAGDYPGRLVFSTTADGASSPTERLRITSAGLVGIGTSSPQSALSVNTTINAGNEGGLKVVNNVANTSFGHGLIVEMPNFASSWGGDSNYSIAKFVDAAGTAAFIGGARSYFRSNVGIGTTSPGSYNANLAVYSEGGAFVGSLHDGTFGTFPKVSAISLGADTVSYTYTTNGTTVALTGSAHIAALQSASAGAGTDIAFLNTAGGSVTEKARIDSSGRLLVGTASSLLSYSKLQVQGGAGVDTGAHICLSNENSARGANG
jgi:hypothetical protein